MEEMKIKSFISISMWLEVYGPANVSLCAAMRTQIIRKKDHSYAVFCVVKRAEQCWLLAERGWTIN